MNKLLTQYSKPGVYHIYVHDTEEKELPSIGCDLGSFFYNEREKQWKYQPSTISSEPIEILQQLVDICTYLNKHCKPETFE